MIEVVGPVLSFCFDLDIVQYCLDVAVEVDVSLQFVQELALYCVFSDKSVFRVVLGDDACAVFLNFGNAKRNVV
jgi:hypothetical protein